MISKTTKIRIWDLPVRLFHWLLVLSIMALLGTASSGNMEAHGRVGCGVFILVLFRLTWGIVGSQTARFSEFVGGPDAIRTYLQSGRSKSAGHNPLGALMIVAMLMLLFAQVSLGLFSNDGIAYQGPLAHLISATTSETVSNLHVGLFRVLLAMIFVHVAAVIGYRFFRKENLILPMITGQKLIIGPAPTLSFKSPTLALAILIFLALTITGILRLASLA